MMLLNILLTIAVFIIQLLQCNGMDVQYSFKVVSDTKEDDFAYSLATAHQRLVIGAPWGNYILPEPGVKVRGPEGSELFGLHLDVNEQFMVVSGQRPHSVYIYSSTHPYTLVARIPVGNYVRAVKVLEDNTIIVGTDRGHVFVYKYTHNSSWDKHQQIDLKGYHNTPGFDISLAVSGDILAVGYYDGHYGRVAIYNKIDDQYTYTTTLRSPNDLDDFGISVAMKGQHLVVSSRKDYDSILFTYEFDPSGGKWMMTGRLTARSPDGLSYVSLQNGILAATVNDQHNNPEVCAYVYKLSNNNSNNNRSSNIMNISNNVVFTWKKVATLKTNGVPTTPDQRHYAISVQDGLIFTGRMDFNFDLDGYGTVFVHDLNKH